MTPTERIERAARAMWEYEGVIGVSFDELSDDDRAELAVAAGKITEAAYPELTSNTHWLAPMEVTEGMLDRVKRGFAMMRDAYLEQQSDIQAGLDALKEPKAGTWDERRHEER